MSARFRSLVVLAVASLITAAVPHQVLTPTRWALVIGISDYANYGDEPGGDLPGAANDARNFREMLVGRVDVPAENIHMLLDGAATKARIEQEMTQWLPSVVRPGDLVWIYFAGHGSQVWDQNMDEQDGMDETFCPTDVGPVRPDGDIRDDELERWLAALPAADVLLVWDKCHAESSMRASMPFARARVLGRDIHALPRPTGMRVPREERTSRGLGARATEVPAMEEWRSDATPRRGTGPVVVELAAAEADQVAMDVGWPNPAGNGRVYGGAFTTNLVRNFWQAPVDGTIEEVFRRTANDLRAQRFEQRPTLIDPTGIASRTLDALAGAAPTVPSVAPSATAPAVAPGAAPAPSAPAEATKPVAAPAAVQSTPAASAGASVRGLPVLSASGGRIVLGAGVAAGVTVGSVYAVGAQLLRVVEIAPTRAVAEPVAGPAAAAPVTPGSTAVLIAHHFPARTLRVSIAELAPQSQIAIIRSLATAPGLALIRSAADYADVVIRSDANGYVVLGLDGFPRHRIAGIAGAAIDSLSDVLALEARANQLALLDNPAQPFTLEFGFDDADNDLHLDERVRLDLRSGRGGYLTIVDFPADGSVSVVFPTEPGQDNRIPANETFYLPRASDPPITVVPPLGRSLVRAFVTERPLDIRAEAGDPHFGEHVLEALRAAAGPSPLPGSSAMRVSNWATASVVYDVVR